MCSWCTLLSTCSAVAVVAVRGMWPEYSALCTVQGLQLSRNLFAFLQGLQFSDKDEHMYFWFPLLAGLSELTFDPRQDIRYSALEVLFDTLMFHGSAFTLPFWTRIFDSVLLPIFDHVRAEVGQNHRCTSAVAFMLLARHCCCSAAFDQVRQARCHTSGALLLSMIRHFWLGGQGAGALPPFCTLLRLAAA